MNKRNNFYIILISALLGIGVGCKAQQQVEFAKVTSNASIYPEFSWDKMPLYMHVRKLKSFTDEEIDYLSNFPLITLEKTTGSRTYGGTERGSLQAAKAIKSVNPKSKILLSKFDYQLGILSK